MAPLLAQKGASELYTCLQEDLWPAICTTMDSGSPDEKAKAVQLLDKVLTRLMIETKQDERDAKDWF